MQLIKFSLLAILLGINRVNGDSSTGHYLGCLHESQCKKVLEGEYCCPAGTCCHFWQKNSNQLYSRCKRIEEGPLANMYCQKTDAVILSGSELFDKRHYERPPNQGSLCVYRREKGRYDIRRLCFDGTDSEEEDWKKRGIRVPSHFKDHFNDVYVRPDADYDDEVDSQEFKQISAKLLRYLVRNGETMFRGPEKYDAFNKRD